MPRKSSSEPTEAELAILHVLWARGPSSVREVWQALGEKSGYTTVLKFLQIMLEKGLVRRNDAELAHVYEAAVAEEATKGRIVGRMVDRLFAGSTGQLVLRALSEKPASPDEIKAIREFLAREERKRK